MDTTSHQSKDVKRLMINKLTLSYHLYVSDLDTKESSSVSADVERHQYRCCCCCCCCCCCYCCCPCRLRSQTVAVWENCRLKSARGQQQQQQQQQHHEAVETLISRALLVDKLTTTVAVVSRAPLTRAHTQQQRSIATQSIHFTISFI